MKAIKPRRMRKGDTIGIVVPASPPPDTAVIDKSVSVMEQLGYRVVLGQHCRKRWGFLAGSDEERAADMQKMFADPEIQMIMCLRGGWGSARILNLLDFYSIAHNPKIFVGFSDITMLHIAITQMAGFVTFHGPMMTSHFTKDNLPVYTSDSFWRMVTDIAPFGSILMKDSEKPLTLVEGQAEGPLIGGNLSIIVTTLGTPFEIQTEGKILFFEDVDEKPYRIDRMLTHLINAGKLQQCAGIICGAFTGEEPEQSDEWKQNFEDVLRDRLIPLGIPVAIGFPFGHVDINATLPVGVPARLVADREQSDLIILGSAVQ